jgi:hypothetical protein
MVSHRSLHSQCHLEYREYDHHISQAVLYGVPTPFTLSVPPVIQRICPTCKPGSPPWCPNVLHNSSASFNARIWPSCKSDCSIQSPSVRCIPSTPVTEIMSHRSLYTWYFLWYSHSQLPCYCEDVERIYTNILS